jgi:DNA modification methylase
MAERMRQKKSMIAVGERMDGSTRTRVHDEEIGKGIQHKHLCKKCGAKRMDSQIGQEDTVDGYVQKMVEVFREVRRILRDDGTLWLNLGDSYMIAKNCAPPPQTVGGQRGMPSDFVPPNRKDQKGLKTKDLIGIPWRVAFALQTDGWYLRQDIIWNKPNPMPESVEDRCTKAHEYIFLLSKKPHYYYDHEAVKEPLAESSVGRAERKQKLIDRTGVGTLALGKQIKDGVNTDHGYAGLALGRNGKTGYSKDGKRNKRSVWTVNAKGYKGAHFAVYPENLILPCVLAGCPQDGTVFDPFTGSGTTAVVALKNGRNYIGTELNPEYVQIAEERIKEEIPTTLNSLFS